MGNYRDYHGRRHAHYEGKNRVAGKSEYNLRTNRLLTESKKAGDNKDNMSLERRIKSYKR